MKNGGTKSSAELYIHSTCTRQLKWKLTLVQIISALGSTWRLIWPTTAQTIGFYLPGSFIMPISCSFFNVLQHTLLTCAYYRTLSVNISCLAKLYEVYYRIHVQCIYLANVLKEDNKIYEI